MKLVASVSRKNWINRVFRHEHHVRDMTDKVVSGKYQYDYNSRCNNCKSSYWKFAESERYPRYCWRCQRAAMSLEARHEIDYWDTSDEIPF